MPHDHDGAALAARADQIIAEQFGPLHRPTADQYVTALEQAGTVVCEPTAKVRSKPGRMSLGHPRKLQATRRYRSRLYPRSTHFDTQVGSTDLRTLQSSLVHL